MKDLLAELDAFRARQAAAETLINGLVDGAKKTIADIRAAETAAAGGRAEYDQRISAGDGSGAQAALDRIAAEKNKVRELLGDLRGFPTALDAALAAHACPRAEIGAVKKRAEEVEKSAHDLAWSLFVICDVWPRPNAYADVRQTVENFLLKFI